MMDRIAGNDRVKRTRILNPIYPSRVTIIEILKNKLISILLELFPRLFQHWLRKIHEHTMSRWILTQNSCSEDSISTTQIHEVFDGSRSRFEN